MDSNFKINKANSNNTEKRNKNQNTKNVKNIETNRDASSEESDLERERSYDTLSFKPKRLYKLDQESPSRTTLVNQDGSLTDPYPMPTEIKEGYDGLHISPNNPGVKAIKKETSEEQNPGLTHIKGTLREGLEKYQDTYNKSKSNLNYSDSDNKFMYDEYIPGLNYDDVANTWQNIDTASTKPSNLKRVHEKAISRTIDNKPSTSSSNASFSSASLSSLNDSLVFTSSHAQVEPIPFPNIDSATSGEKFSKTSKYKPIEINGATKSNQINLPLDNSILKDSSSNGRSSNRLYTPLSSLAIDRQLKISNAGNNNNNYNDNNNSELKNSNGEYFTQNLNPNSHTFKSNSSITGRRLSSTANDSCGSYSSSLSLAQNSLNGNTTSMTLLVELNMRPDEIFQLMNDLPGNFLALPYTQRKKLLIENKPDKNYKILMNLIKKFTISSSKSNLSLKNFQSSNQLSSMNNSRQQQQAESIPATSGMTNSVASQYLNSFTPSIPSSFTSNFNHNILHQMNSNNSDDYNNLHSDYNCNNSNVNLSCKNSSFRSDDKGREILEHILGKIIGFGAWGLIRECYDINTGICRAIKIVRFRNNEKLKRQVFREVKIWSLLKHINILPLLDWKLDNEYAMYCLTERIYDGTLYDLVITWDEFSQTKINFQQRCTVTARLCKQLVSALLYMHSQNIVHGDIKLENCLLEKKSDKYPSWRVLVCDFGMSCHFGSMSSTDDSLVDITNDTQLIDEKNSLGLTQHEWNDGRLKSDDDFPCSFSVMDPRSRTLYINNHFGMKSHSSEKLAGLSKIMKSRSSNNPIQERNTFDKVSIISHLSSLPKNYLEPINSDISTVPDSKVREGKHNRIKRAPTIAMGDHGPTIRNSNMATGPDPHANIGSLPYAAPELIAAESRHIDPSSDIWALGVLMYTMLVGKLPFKNDYSSRLSELIQSGIFDKESLQIVCRCKMVNIRKSALSSNDHAFEKLYEIILGCLTVDLEKRWDLEKIKQYLTIISDETLQ